MVKRAGPAKRARPFARPAGYGGIAVRVPGPWYTPEDLVEYLPPGICWDSEGLHLRDGSSVRCAPQPADEEFRNAFARACRTTPAPRDQEVIEDASLFLGLFVAGGSIEVARRMMQAVGVLIEAGGAGAFVDNGLIAHGGDVWLALAEHAAVVDLVAGFVGVCGSERVYSLGMHALGLSDVSIPRSGNDERDEVVVRTILDFVSQPAAVVGAGTTCTADGLAFRFVERVASIFPRSSPVHNPHGQWRLEPA